MARPRPSFEIVNVRPTPSGDWGEDILGLVTFKYRPDTEMGALTQSRYDKEGEREYPIVHVAGEAPVLTFVDCPVRQGEKGPWVQAHGFRLDFNTGIAIAEQAAEALRVQAEHAKSAGYTGNGRVTNVAEARGGMVRNPGWRPPVTPDPAPASGRDRQPESAIDDLDDWEIPH